MIQSIKHFALEAPTHCSKLLKERDSRVGGAVDLFCAKSYRQLTLVASGSSFNIASSVRWFLEDVLAMPVEVISPATYCHYGYRFQESSFIFCMSQSGKSTNTIQSVLKAKEVGSDVAVLCADPKGTIQSYCDHVFCYGAGIDDYYVAKGFPVSVLFLMAFGIEAGFRRKTLPEKTRAALYKDLERLISAMPAYHNASETFYQRHKEELFRMKRVMLCGIGGSYGSALEGALKLSETTGIASNGYELEEFLHGPYYEINKNYAIFIFDTVPELHNRATAIYDALSSLTDRLYLLTAFHDREGDHVLTFDADVDYRLYAITGPIPFQLISSNICEDLDIQAINLEHYKVTEKVTTKI